MTSNPEPRTLAERLEYVGPELYGPRGWTYRLAEGLGTSRSQLFEYRRGARPDRDVDAMLLALLERERDAVAERGPMLIKLRHKLIGFIAKSRKD